MEMAGDGPLLDERRGRGRSEGAGLLVPPRDPSRSIDCLRATSRAVRSPPAVEKRALYRQKPYTPRWEHRGASLICAIRFLGIS